MIPYVPVKYVHFFSQILSLKSRSASCSAWNFCFHTKGSSENQFVNA